MKRGISGVLGTALALAVFAAVPGAQAQERDAPMTREPALRAFGLQGGSGAYLGVSIADVDGTRAEDAGLDSEYGVYLEDVSGGGPADEAGLEPGDVLVAWNGERLESAAQLQRLVRETPAGREVTLTAVRNGGERDVTVELGDRADAMGNLRIFTVPREREALRDRLREGLDRRDRGNVRVEVFGRRARLGVSVQSLSDQLAEHFGVDGGMLVFSVSEDSPAEAAGVRAGDVIVEVAGEPVDDHGDIWRILSDREAGPVEVLVVRDGAERTLTVELDEDDVREGGSGGMFYFDDGNAVWMDGFRGSLVHPAPFRVDEVRIGPLELDALDLRLPVIEIPPIEIPAIEVPELVVPRVWTGVRTIDI